MRVLLVISLFACLSCVNTSEKSNPNKKYLNKPKIVLVLHGGAGHIVKESMSDSLTEAYKTKLTEAAMAGFYKIKEGESAVHAVEASIKIMENSPLFNSGKGAVFTKNMQHELDASIMDGASQNAGAVAGVQYTKNPISLARAVMEYSPHVLLSGQGADSFALTQNLTQVPNNYFSVEDKRQAFLQKNASFYDAFIQNKKYGTVGCVALDSDGNLAAGTSTGGMSNKQYNRIGDSPLIGAGTYAENEVCGVSCTGWGEYFIRNVAAYDVAARIKYNKESVNNAVESVLQKIEHMGATGGIIALNNNGEVAMHCTTKGMFRATVSEEGKVEVGFFETN